ncbi:MAG: 4Fe-4S cluster-binding domain-containing protein [Oscillospiraceae bacterium]|nr:4Fe-4S cluster-binding domain-containing protein [Oscillospiraceae bacterium]
MDFICNDCPRRCGVRRTDTTGGGVCLSPALPRVVRAAPHFGEEPCISGPRGAGTIFFSGCNLRCVFCQNREISRQSVGKPVDAQGLRELMLRLRDQGVHNIDLVTPTHFTRVIARALEGLELGIPVVWNSSGYESVETLRMLEGLVQVYMPDLKYMKADPARRYSAAADYPEAARAAIREMFRQRGPYVLDSEGILQSGVLVRHLILPGQDLNAMDAVDFVAEEFPAGSILFSLMSQYTPMPGLDRFPELQAPIEPELNDRLCAYMRRYGPEGYCQDLSSATREQIPAFDGTGV